MAKEGSKSKPKKVETILATDCGSTTTKAILIEKKGDEYRLVVRGEAPTTVEAPFEDVTRGVLNSIREVEELTGKRILDGERVIKPTKSAKEGVDVFISTSSAGGGLQMMVAGVVLTMTGESAARAALGAGAIVMDVIASNDGRLPHQKIERIRHLRPDMILLSGGIDGGTVSHVAELAELIRAADPKPRFGTTYSLPVIYAGNKDARKIILDTLKESSELVVVENLRPVLERENLGPARDKIHELFMEHVMAHAPGYKTLMDWTDVPIMPTPGAVGLLIERIGKRSKIDVLGVDIGGATTDIFSVFEDKTEEEENPPRIFNRTVSANLGMSYSISNVLVEAGTENIMRWIPFDADEATLRNRIRNKMIRPTTIPATLDDLKMEHAVAREALRLALEQHCSMAVGLKGVQKERSIADAFSQSVSGESLVNMMSLAMIVGSGGALSHSPRRVQAAMLMLDAFQPEGVTLLAVDSIFMMPHLGVLTEVNEEAAQEVFEKDCLIPICTSIAPVGEGKLGADCLKVVFKPEKGSKRELSLKFGDIASLPLGTDETAKVELYPERGFNIGADQGKSMETEIKGGLVGVIIDCRGRPLILPEDNSKRIKLLNTWAKSVDMYPE
ncbi:methylaspartate mutase [candidate division WOR-3 bacterium]|uniref:Methylaspartate mutase n=1 Tax=candidate division WOR-3 bacterium TaxID=2052148 RepID=A0A9D5QC86_UNCW3|nr:methylaspartate mutase [candidate division WOR-3 bacterium]MBD3363777.1 methylaspartate mutase [candidate division WOR-3 bacterium]